MNTKNPVRIIEINSYGGAKNIDLVVGFKEQRLKYFIIFRKNCCLNLILRCVHSGAKSDTLMNYSTKEKKGEEGRVLHMLLNSFHL